MNVSRLALLGLCWLPVAVVAAQDAPSTLPTSVPATAPTSQPATVPSTQAAEGKLEAVPPGLVRVTNGQFSAFCLPVDEAWVKPTLGNVSLQQQPTTRPSNILANIAKNKDAVAQGLTNDLGIDGSKATAFFNDQLIPQLDKLDHLQPPVVFLVTTEQKIVGLINNSWKHPRIAYNRLMDQIRFDDRVFISTDRPMDEVMMLAVYDPTDDLNARAKKLKEAMNKFATDIAFAVATRGRMVTQQSIATIVEQEVFVPLKLPANQEWLDLGVANYMTAQYASQFTGADPKQLLADLTFENPNAFPKADSMDLLNLPDLRQVLPQYQMANIAAAKRKATLAIQALVIKAGPGAIRRALNSVRKNPPKTPDAMVALITGATDVDLTPDLRPKR